MLPNQQCAVDLNMVILVAALEREAPVFINYLEQRCAISLAERELIVSESSFSAQKLTNLLHTLKTKDDGFLYLLNYLRAHNKSSLAVKLQIEAKRETGRTVKSNTRCSALEEFSHGLAKYYKLNYTDVPTMGESAKHVKDVWVPLHMDGRREAHLDADRIDHVELLNRLTSDEGHNVALIKGDPGMGKTTLAKKIAYDWAVSYGTSSTQQFSLVLAVPLRSAGKSGQLDHLAIDYFFSIGGGQLVKGINKEKLKEAIITLESQLLVILDGLDEYDSYSKSPFTVMFSSPFQHSSAHGKEPPPYIPFKLIITSRPYACDCAQMDFPLLRFIILPLDSNHLDDFVQFYCETSRGTSRVTEYLKVNAKLVIKVPLILTFVCYLADSVEEIPTNMTSLYDSFIRQMIRRENRHEKLAKWVDIQSWKDSNVGKSTSQLAYRGMIDFDFEFSKSNLEKCHVTNDSFICGFLLHKFNFAQENLTAEFPHRSIQEFFAALHCYQLVLSGSKDELKEVNKIIINRGDSLVGRFFFGICSKEKKFDQMTKWLRPSLCRDNVIRPTSVINAFHSALVDCSAEQNFNIGQKLFDSAENLGDYIINVRHEYFIEEEFLLRTDALADDFKKGLNLGVPTVDEDRSTNDWYLADNRKSARLAFVHHGLQELLEEKFGQIDCLMMRYDSNRRSPRPSPSLHSVKQSRTEPQSDIQSISETFVHQIEQLPPVVTVVITPDFAEKFTFTTITVRVRYRRGMGLKLNNFQFRYKDDDKEELLDIAAHEKVADLTVDETIEVKRSGEMWKFRMFKVTVTVTEDMSQSTLIFSLMRLSLYCDELRNKLNCCQLL